MSAQNVSGPGDRGHPSIIRHPGDTLPAGEGQSPRASSSALGSSQRNRVPAAATIGLDPQTLYKPAPKTVGITAHWNGGIVRLGEVL